MMIEIDNCYNIDCMDGMRFMQGQGIKADWCIADPPYGIGIEKMSFTHGGNKIYNSKCKRRDYSQMEEWDKARIGGGYFDLMRECSKEQIIFGGNYYTDILSPTKSWLIWNKRSYAQTDRNDFADCELAWCSKGVARVINYMYNGMLQDDMKNKHIDRFHPTEKPIGMWYKLLHLYTKENDLILDPFAGSQSLRIACYKTKRHYIGFEIDKTYYEKGCKWFSEISAQMSFFD